MHRWYDSGQKYWKYWDETLLTGHCAVQSKARWEECYDSFSWIPLSPSSPGFSWTHTLWCSDRSTALWAKVTRQGSGSGGPRTDGPSLRGPWVQEGLGRGVRWSLPFLSVQPGPAPWLSQGQLGAASCSGSDRPASWWAAPELCDWGVPGLSVPVSDCALGPPAGGHLHSLSVSR